MTREEVRLQEARDRTAHWKRWGPYLAERQWGTVREDYSPRGTAWDSFPHDHARSRAYRWGEDGIAGICDNHGRLCLALATARGSAPAIRRAGPGSWPSSSSRAASAEPLAVVFDRLAASPTWRRVKRWGCGQRHKAGISALAPAPRIAAGVTPGRQAEFDCDARAVDAGASSRGETWRRRSRWAESPISPMPTARLFARSPWPSTLLANRRAGPAGGWSGHRPSGACASETTPARSSRTSASRYGRLDTTGEPYGSVGSAASRRIRRRAVAASPRSASSERSSSSASRPISASPFSCAACT